MKYSTQVLLSVAFLFAVGCSKNQSATTADGSKVTVSSKGEGSHMDITSKSGEKISLNANANGVDLPAEFPKDLPLYRKRVILTANQMGKEQMLEGIQEAAPVPDVVTV